MCTAVYSCTLQIAINLYKNYLSIGLLYTTQYTEKHSEPEHRILFLSEGLCWARYHLNHFIIICADESG